MNINRLVNVRHQAQPGAWEVTLAGGRIGAFDGPHDVAAAPARHAGDTLDCGGGLLTPTLVDPHVHLDLAYSLDLVPENVSGTLGEAIGLWCEAKAHISAENTRARARKAIETEVSYGTGVMRSHVDVGTSAGLRLADGVLAAREDTRDICKIQLTAFPQDGLIRDPGALDNMRAALQRGFDLVGGIPHVERTPQDGRRHLELVFDLAQEFDANIDVHIDESDDPDSQFTEQLADLTIARGWQGRVTASHVCALASYDHAHAAKVIGLLAEARVDVVTNPGVNLHLQGRHDRYPKRRGLTRVRELLAAGVRCGAGQDCIVDPFYPLGKGQLLEQVFLLVHAEHMSTPDLMFQAMQMVCCHAGEILGLGQHRPEPGAPANVAVWPVTSIPELIRERPRPLAVLHAGRLVAGTLHPSTGAIPSC